METNQQIQLVQKPVILHALEQVGAQVTARLSELNIDGQVATEDTVKSLKSLRAELNKELTDYEAQRKAVKEGVLNPYNEFEAVYKTEISDKYKAAVDSLKLKIDQVELTIKTRKRDNIVAYFTELAASEEIDFLKFEQLGIEINLSTSEKQYKESVNAFIEKVKDDIALINCDEFAHEMMAEYKITLNASKAITTVRERKEREKMEAERMKKNELIRRQQILQSMAFIYRDITKTWEWVESDSVFVRESEISNMAADEFRSLIASFESTIKSMKQAAAMQVSTPEQPEPAPAPAPTPKPQPIPEQPKSEEIFTAEFRVEATMAKLKQLGEFLKQNDIKYTNI